VALLPMIVKTLAAKDPHFTRARTLLTIHNLMYQGSFPVEVGPDTNLGSVSHLFHQDLMKAGRLNFLLQGILYADGVSTVSRRTPRRSRPRPTVAGSTGSCARARPRWSASSMASTTASGRQSATATSRTRTARATRAARSATSSTC